MSSNVKFSGPAFDGRAESALNRGTVEIRHKLAAEGVRLVSAAFVALIRDDHGYVRHITTTDTPKVYQTGKYTLVEKPDSADETLVTTDIATYGPWLEGTGSRNETTRFKGYHGFRIAAQELDLKTEKIADEALEPYMKEMN